MDSDEFDELLDCINTGAAVPQRLIDGVGEEAYFLMKASPVKLERNNAYTLVKSLNPSFTLTTSKEERSGEAAFQAPAAWPFARPTPSGAQILEKMDSLMQEISSLVAVVERLIESPSDDNNIENL